MRRSLAALVVGVVASLAAGPAVLLSAGPAQAASSAQLSVFHGVPGLTVDVYLDGKKAIDDFKPGMMAGPLTVPAGKHVIAITAADATDDSKPAIGPVTVTPAAGANYTAVAHLTAAGKPTATLFTNDTATIAAGNGRLDGPAHGRGACCGRARRRQGGHRIHEPDQPQRGQGRPACRNAHGRGRCGNLDLRLRSSDPPTSPWWQGPTRSSTRGGRSPTRTSRWPSRRSTGSAHRPQARVPVMPASRLRTASRSPASAWSRSWWPSWVSASSGGGCTSVVARTKG